MAVATYIDKGNIMDISKMTIRTVQGPEDGTTHALVKGDTAILVPAYSMEEAQERVAQAKVAPNKGWVASTEKAVHIPGVWEYDMATFQGEA